MFPRSARELTAPAFTISMFLQDVSENRPISMYRWGVQAHPARQYVLGTFSVFLMKSVFIS